MKKIFIVCVWLNILSSVENKNFLYFLSGSSQNDLSSTDFFSKDFFPTELVM